MQAEQQRSGRAATPLSIKLWFGAPSFAGGAIGVPVAVHLAQFYSDTVLVPLGYIAIAIALARAVDALSDPLMGWISDRTRTRWGRRKPHILLGAPLCAIFFWALFTPPQGLGPLQAPAWFGATFCVFLLANKLYLVPHAALGAELTLDYHERSSLFGIQSIFAQVGVLVSALLPALLLGVLGPGSEREAFSLMAAVLALLLVVLYALMLWRVPERPEFMARESNPLVPGIRRALRNGPFRILFLFAVITALPAAIPAVMLRYFTFYVVRPEQPEQWLGVFLATFFLSGIAFIPAWMAIARRHGKLRAFVASYVIGAFGSILFFFAGQGDTLYVTAVCALVGIQSAAGFFLMPAMGADTIDYDELLTGRRREAQFGALWTILPKFVAIPGSAIPLAILASVGYAPNRAQTPEVLLAIRLLMGVFPLVFSAAALAVLVRYPISESIHASIRLAIAARERGEPVTDPLTGSLLAPPAEREVEEETGWFLDHFSRGELRRSLRLGNASIMRGVLRSAALALVSCVAAAWLALAHVSSAGMETGTLAVIGVVAAGLSLTAFLFHALRIGPARRMLRAPVSAELVRLHLRTPVSSQG